MPCKISAARSSEESRYLITAVLTELFIRSFMPKRFGRNRPGLVRMMLLIIRMGPAVDNSILKRGDTGLMLGQAVSQESTKNFPILHPV
jgi:hypothetical protein